jgi:mRNA-degrading endonuclease toxin of MazEF toxin-antitoxin module
MAHAPSVKVKGKSSEIAADQIRTVSKSRLGKKLGTLTPATRRPYAGCWAKYGDG